MVDADGANLHRLTGPGRGNWHPRWSRDGEKIIFSSNRKSERRSEQPQICVMDADGSNVRQLTKDARPALRPYWSPDGKRIVFMSTSGGDSKDWKNYGLYVMDADGSNVRSLGVNNAGHPAW